MASLYDIPVTTLDGRETTMNDWAGHVLLIVNTASKCGLTGQYEGLQRIFNDYAMRGFFVIGMPCNQFGEQEPGTADEISDFCSVNYGVSFPLLAKADVNGENTLPSPTSSKPPKKTCGASSLTSADRTSPTTSPKKPTSAS